MNGLRQSDLAMARTHGRNTEALTSTAIVYGLPVSFSPELENQLYTLRPSIPFSSPHSIPAKLAKNYKRIEQAVAVAHRKLFSATS